MQHGKLLNDAEWVQFAIDKSDSEERYFDLIFGRVRWGRIFWNRKYGGKLIGLAKLRNPYRCKKFVWVENERAKEIRAEIGKIASKHGVSLEDFPELKKALPPPRKRKRCNAPLGSCEHTRKEVEI